MSTLRVNTITNEASNGAPEFTNGMDFPPGINFKDTSEGATSIGIGISSPTGIMTATSLSSQIVNVSGVCTATTFTGVAGAIGLTGLPGIPNGKAIALTLVT